MAKLIVSRPQRFADRFRHYRIAVDGEHVAKIGRGAKVEIELAPGRHEITARLDFFRSQPVQIEAGREGVHHLRVGSNLLRRNPETVAFLLASLAPYAFIFFIILFSKLIDNILGSGWLTVLTGLAIILPSLLLVALKIVWRDHYLYLEEIPTPDETARQVALPAVQPRRVRITFRQMMIAVAILAVLLGAGIEWTRYTRGDYFRDKASFHAQIEAQFREFEQDYLRTATEFEKLGLNAGSSRRSAARFAAKADYHAAMRRKYEEAASRRVFAVEADPPEPP